MIIYQNTQASIQWGKWVRAGGWATIRPEYLHTPLVDIAGCFFRKGLNNKYSKI